MAGTKRNTIPEEVVEADVAVARRLLAGKPGVVRVWLFGSVGKGVRAPDWRSDLDFAVEGLDPDDLYSGWSELDSQLRMPVDLVRWEDASDFLRSEIVKGKIVWEVAP
ncbi:MAG: nucleotidyltransferase domain-containing protein [Verrucomicrobia bacterium]|nr:nucleotidyltransferase domain-containing protein [Verrucomicrobiota bacterium]